MHEEHNISDTGEVEHVGGCEESQGKNVMEHHFEVVVTDVVDK